jgi:chlorite dismutase
MTQENIAPDLRERGRLKDGTAIFSSRRLWIQFLAFGGCRDVAPLREALEASGQTAALYADLNDSQGVGLVRMHEDPEFFVSQGREFLNTSVFADLLPKPELTMTGRTYAVGYENDLDEVLVQRPQGRILDPSLGWAIWYPVKRTKAFEALAEADKHTVMMDHGDIGKRFGKAGMAHDIRLASHGLDFNDNDFVIGILSADLAAGSLVVQAMRKSLQTMHHLEALGPFFTGRVLGQWAGGPKV